MRFTKDPFHGLNGIEVCKRIYNYNRTYEEDAKEIEEIIGGEKNLISIKKWDINNSTAPFPNCSAYLLEIVDYNNSSLAKDKSTSRIVGGTTYIELKSNNKFVIYTTGVIADGLEELTKNWSNEEQLKELEIRFSKDGQENSITE